MPRRRRLDLAAAGAIVLGLTLAASPVEARGVVLPVVFHMGPSGPEAANAAVLNLPQVVLGQPSQVRPAFSNGGCTTNGACSNLTLVWAYPAYVQRNADHFIHGAATYSHLVPDRPPHDGFYYDFADTLTNLTSDGDSICIIKNVHSSDSPASVPISYWPTGHRSTASRGTETVGIAAGGASFQATFNVSEGYLDADISGGPNRGPRFFGSWGYGDATEEQAADECNLRGAAMESGIAFRTSTSAGQPSIGAGATFYYQQNA